MLIIADCLGVYKSGLSQPLLALIPSMAIPLINALMYLLSPKT